MNLGLFILRVVVGGLFIGHGTQKLFGWFEGNGLEGTGGWLHSLGYRPGERWAAVGGGSEAGAELAGDLQGLAGGKPADAAQQ